LRDPFFGPRPRYLACGGCHVLTILVPFTSLVAMILLFVAV
jgi:hypothetical protein